MPDSRHSTGELLICIVRGCVFLHIALSYLQSVQRGVAESMVSGRVRGCVFLPTALSHLQRFDMIYDGNDKSSGLPRGMPLVTCTFASSKHA
jgi:hypothetical protein